MLSKSSARSLLILATTLSALAACGGKDSSRAITPTGTDNSLFSVGGTIGGLTGTGLVLDNNGGDSLTVTAQATTFTFATPVASGAAYAVTVGSQPTGQTCTVAAGSGVVSAAVTSVAVTCTTNATVSSYTVGGTVTGLTGSGLVLVDNGTDHLTVAANATTFSFATPITSGGAYAVTVGTQPTGQTCTVAAGSGVVSAAVTSVAVTCTTNAVASYKVGGTVIGLTGSGLVLVDNGTDHLTVAANATTFTFATSIAKGGTYAVIVGSQPTGQTCMVTSGTGTISATVTNVVVTCTAPISVSACPTVTSGAMVGVWENITPPAFVSPSNMQTVSVAVDPLNPSNVYASAGNNTNGGNNTPTSTGVYKSTDCGATWKQVSTGQNSSAVNSGLLWEMKFDSNGANLYVANGYGGPPALFKSSNHGVDWTNLFAGKSFTISGDSNVSAPVPVAHVFHDGGFVQAFSIDPTDGTQQHIVVTFHETCFDGVSAANGGWGVSGSSDPGIGCLGESLDGGTTWRLFPIYQPSQGWQEASTVSAIGPTTYLHITPAGVYYTGNGGSTWQPVYYTSDGGSTWTLMSKGYSAYGENGYLGPDGTLYLGLTADTGAGVLYSKTTSGNPMGAPKNWSLLANSPQATIVFSDGLSLYASRGFLDTSGQPFYSAPLANPTSWTHSTNATDPSNPVQGPYEYAYDPVNHIMYAAGYSGGLLRLITQAPAN